MTAMSENKQVPSRESQMVVLRRDGKGTPTVWCDPEIADLVDALNCGSLSTLASCSGHGEKPGIISLKDGRELLILPDYESARMAERAVLSASAGENKDAERLEYVLAGNKVITHNGLFRVSGSGSYEWHATPQLAIDCAIDFAAMNGGKE